MLRKDFFISYSSKDLSRAEWIAWELNQAGYSTVLQAWDFHPGENFVLRMHNASKGTKRTIILLSPDFFKSNFTQAEWTAAFKRDPTGEKGILLPILVHECKQQITGLLGPIIYIDLVELDETAARKALLNGVQRGPTRLMTPPPFPGFPKT